MSVTGGSAVADPMLTVAPIEWVFTMTPAASKDNRTRLAMLIASAAAAGSSAANSSPPKRAPVSFSEHEDENDHGGDHGRPCQQPPATAARSVNARSAAFGDHRRVIFGG